jgi:hypothetical protein
LTWKSMQENVIRLTGPCGPVRIYTVTTGTWKFGCYSGCAPW